MFGFVLLNDWSARDIQGWEYQPLGPFLAKNFATTISPWIVTLEALAPFRSAFRASGRRSGAAALSRLAREPRRRRDRHHARSLAANRARCASAVMRAIACRRRTSATRTGRSRSSSRITRSTAATCSPGDLLGSGTMSGPTPAAGRLAARAVSRRASSRCRCPAARSRTFLEDGDTVILRAFCERPGFRRIGFGECRGTVLPARRARRRADGPPCSASSRTSCSTARVRAKPERDDWTVDQRWDRLHARRARGVEDAVRAAERAACPAAPAMNSSRACAHCRSTRT